MIRFVLVCVALSASLACCSAEPQVPSEAASPLSPSGSSVADDGGYFVPRHHLREAPQAELKGTLIERGQCLVARPDDPRDQALHLVVWPEDATVVVNSAGTSIQSRGKAVVVGATFTAGGGEYPDRSFIEKVTGRVIPIDCQTPTYWLVSEVT